MNKKPNNRLTYFLIAFITFLTTYSITSYIENNQLKSNIVSIEKNIEKITSITLSDSKVEITKNLLDIQYKENIFLSQLSTNTTIILTSIGFILTLGALLSFKSFNDLMENYKNQINKQISSINKTVSEKADSVDLEQLSETLTEEKQKINSTIDEKIAKKANSSNLEIMQELIDNLRNKTDELTLSFNNKEVQNDVGKSILKITNLTKSLGEYHARELIKQLRNSENDEDPSSYIRHYINFLKNEIELGDLLGVHEYDQQRSFETMVILLDANQKVLEYLSRVANEFSLHSIYEEADRVIKKIPQNMQKEGTFKYIKSLLEDIKNEILSNADHKRTFS